MCRGAVARVSDVAGRRRGRLDVSALEWCLERVPSVAKGKKKNENHTQFGAMGRPKVRVGNTLRLMPTGAS